MLLWWCWSKRLFQPCFYNTDFDYLVIELDIVTKPDEHDVIVACIVVESIIFMLVHAIFVDLNDSGLSLTVKSQKNPIELYSLPALAKKSNTHSGLNKMAAISQTEFSIAISLYVSSGLGYVLVPSGREP